MSRLTLLILVVFLCSLNRAASEVYHIVADSNDLCTTSCLTLSQFAIDSSHHLRSNISLVFLPGTHYLTINLTLSNLHNFSMYTENSPRNIRIECTSTSHILLYRIKYIYINGLEFVGCEGNEVEGLGVAVLFVLRNAKFEGRGYGGSALQLTKTSAQIFNTTFVFYFGTWFVQPTLILSGYFGGAIFTNHSNISVSHSRFERTHVQFGGTIYSENTAIHIDNCTFSSNVASLGGSLYVFNSTLTVLRSEYRSNSAIEGSGGVLASVFSNILIMESVFENNYANMVGGVLASLGSNITVQARQFKNNLAIMYGGVLYSGVSNFTIQASQFENNLATMYGGVLYSDVSNIIIQTSEFGNNNATIDGGILQFASSTIIIKECDFKNNFANNHGGVLLSSTESSDINIDDSNFTNNSPIGAGIRTTTSHAINEVYYIITDSSDICTAPCLTLSQFAIEFSYCLNRYLNSNITLVFLPGIHHLTVNLTILNVDIFSMSSKNSTAQIFCKNNSNVHILYSQRIEITNLEFTGCGDNEIKKVKEFVLQDTIFNGRNKSGTSLELIETSAIIINSKFVSNRKGKTKEFVETDFNIGLGPWFVGGAIIATHSVIDIIQSIFDSNKAQHGGAIFVEKRSIINMNQVTFINNFGHSGGALSSTSSSVTTVSCKFFSNTATSGGAMHFFNTNITQGASEFIKNVATQEGGALYYHSSNVVMTDNVFTGNNSTIGAVIYSRNSPKLMYQHSLLVANNSADGYAVIYLTNSELYAQNSGNASFLNNSGSLVAFRSNVTLLGYVTFENNHQPQNTFDNFQEGGAITLFQSNAFFDGTCHLVDNYANNGGAILSAESKVYVNGNTNIAKNIASRSGGGIYLSNSEMNLQQKSTFVLCNNTATHKGGGIHAISSSIKTTSTNGVPENGFENIFTGSRLYFTRNQAERGGGLSFEGSAKLYVLKYDIILAREQTIDTNTFIFTGNVADYGGAVYVDDDTNSGTCVSVLQTECFFQVLAIYGLEYALIAKDSKTQSMHFTQNYARISGSTLYGGLLDRCSVSQFAEVLYRKRQYLGARGDGVAYFEDVSFPKNYTFNKFFNIIDESLIATNISISSRPVRVCLCIGYQPNCTQQYHIKIKKGETFIVSLVAIDQINKPVNATIQTSLNFTESGLAEGQLIRKIPAACTDLAFNVISAHNFEKLTLYAVDGPCKDAELSVQTVSIHFLPCSCPIGLQISGINATNCTCECHNDISQYVEQCDSLTGSFIKYSQSRAWISFINDTSLKFNITGYIVYSNCPFDYCLAVPVDLNQPNGADVQCAFNRSSLLCGSCQPDLSLSLGSSRCLPCPSYWPVLLIAITLAAVLAGIALVALLLILNLTVSVGTLNGLIFYCNIVYANKNILLPFQRTNFVTVFISWLNLELGIDTCYFPGMDTYTKTWLQLAFPAYIILLVVLVIIISSYSFRFSNLIGKKDPVATLATLVLLSYAKLLEVCFKSLSVGILTYPDSSSEMLWLPDATVRYLSGKHIPLFIASVLILLIGLVYTALLFSWQWLLYLPRWRIFRWTRDQKLQTFIQTYHTPYTPKHRYWTGLLLLIRAILYLTAAVNFSNDPQIALSIITVLVCCILTFKGIIASSSGVYRQWPVDVLETLFYFNITFFSILTWYSLHFSHDYIYCVAAHHPLPCVHIHYNQGNKIWHNDQQITLKKCSKTKAY